MSCLLSIVFCTLFSMTYGSIQGQQKTSQQAVKKILFTTREAGMGGQVKVSFEVVQEHGQWNSYQTSKLVESDYHPASNEISKTRLLITRLDPKEVTTFLNSIGVIKPKFDWREFGITSASLKKGLQTDKDGNVFRFNELVNNTSIEHAITSCWGSYYTDIGLDCIIKVVKNNRDTIKIESRNQTICMLPWHIGSKETFDINISRFFIQAMGTEDYPNKYRMQTSTLENDVWEKLDGFRSFSSLNPYRWRYGYAKNLKLLKSNFILSDEHIHGISCRCTLKSQDLPVNVSIDAGINITDTAFLHRLPRFKDTVNACIKTSNFVFNYYNKLPGAKIIFETNSETAPTNYIPLTMVEEAIPHLKTVDLSKIINFYIESGERKSQWVLLPDNTLILMTRTGDGVAGLLPNVFQKVKENYFTTGHQFVLFNSDGKIFNQ
jgi:hypothetical protein